MTRFYKIRSLFLVLLGAAALATIQCATVEDPNSGNTGNLGGSGADQNASGGAASGGSATGSGGSIIMSCENEGEKMCAGECQIPNSNAHCGDCFRTCTGGTACTEVSGTYTCACPDGQVRCGGKCIDPQSSDYYCGASGTCTGAEAGVACGDGGMCQDGGCACDADHTKCDGSCVDTATDPLHCGTTPDACGIECKENATCEGGSCVCPSNTTECNAGCFDTNTEPQACGGCPEAAVDPGAVCDTNKGYECRGGTCQCPVGWELCGDSCVDTQNDPENCGGCNLAGGTTTGAVCPYAPAPNAAKRQGCYMGACVSGPCDEAVVPGCKDVDVRNITKCYTNDDYFSGLALKCDNNSGSPGGGIPKDTAVCYEIYKESVFEQFRCWWSGRSMSVNDQNMSCSNSGRTLLDLPPVRAGGYCVYIPPSNNDGASTDGFSMGTK